MFWQSQGLSLVLPVTYNKYNCPRLPLQLLVTHSKLQLSHVPVVYSKIFSHDTHEKTDLDKFCNHLILVPREHNVQIPKTQVGYICNLSSSSTIPSRYLSLHKCVSLYWYVFYFTNCIAATKSSNAISDA